MEDPGVSMLHYIDALRAADQKLADARNDFSKERVQWLEKKSDADKIQQDQKNATQNEWRGTMTDQRNTLAGAGETNIRFGASDARINDIRDAIATMRGKTAGFNLAITAGISLLSAAASATVVYLALRG